MTEEAYRRWAITLLAMIWMQLAVSGLNTADMRRSVETLVNIATTAPQRIHRE